MHFLFMTKTNAPSPAAKHLRRLLPLRREGNT